MMMMMMMIVVASWPKLKQRGVLQEVGYSLYVNIWSGRGTNRPGGKRIGRPSMPGSVLPILVYPNVLAGGWKGSGKFVQESRLSNRRKRGDFLPTHHLGLETGRKAKAGNRSWPSFSGIENVLQKQWLSVGSKRQEQNPGFGVRGPRQYCLLLVMLLVWMLLQH